MIALGFLVVAIGGLAIIYMVRPRFERIVLSAARFFIDQPTSQKSQPRLKRSNPLRSLSFWVQLSVLTALLLTILLLVIDASHRERTSIGLWILIDTSASMSTREGQETRLMQATREVERAIAQAEEAGKKAVVCVRLSSFDMERRELGRDSGAARAALANLLPRPLGTDLNLVRSAQSQLLDQSQSDCTISHLLVVTDLPAPQWVAGALDVPVIWRQVGSSVANVGITGLRASRNQLTGQVHEVAVEVTSFGDKPVDATLTVVTPVGSLVPPIVINWSADSASWETSFFPNGPGPYTIEVSPGGAYSYDDAATIEISAEDSIQVDWQLSDREWLDILGWTQNSADPHLRVVSSVGALASSLVDRTPILLVGEGYLPERDNAVEISGFYEASPLLNDLNFDVAETLVIQGMVEVPTGFRQVLNGQDGRTWLAQRWDPPAAYVPGLPTGTDDDLGRFSATAFFNAVRWLLQERDLAPLYTLTTPAMPTVEGNRIVLHDGEGDTQRAQTSYGSIEQIQPTTFGNSEVPTWPIVLAAAAGLFALERGLAALRGGRWR